MSSFFDVLLTVFRDNGYAAFASCIMSAASLVVAILAWRSSHTTSLRLVEIEEERDGLEKAESSKARLSAQLSKSFTNTYGYELTITNHGRGEARSIRITVDGKNLVEHPALMGKSEKRTLGPN